MPASDHEVVIIGGGAAGIAAAGVLHGAGIDCLLLEARARLGGRAWSVPDGAGAALDLGCGWLHSADRNPLTQIARAQGREIDQTPPPWTRPSLPIGFAVAEQREFRAALEAFHGRLEGAAEAAPDRPAADFLAPHGRWNALIGAVGTYISGAEPERVSAHDLARYDDSGVNWRVVEGLGATIAACGAGLPAALDCPVRRVDHSGRRLRIDTGQGTVTAAQAIVALPTSLLAEPALFAPALPAKTEAAAGLPLGLNDKLFLSLDAAGEFEPDTRLFGRTDRTGTGAYHLRPFGRPQIECYFGGALAWQLEAAGERGFFDFAAGELGALLGSGFARRIRPLRLHRWGADPFARGAYSYARPGCAEARAALAAPVEGRLFFAGEACSRHDFSTVHGAWNSGLAAAEAVLRARV